MNTLIESCLLSWTVCSRSCRIPPVRDLVRDGEAEIKKRREGDVKIYKFSTLLLADAGSIRRQSDRNKKDAQNLARIC